MANPISFIEQNATFLAKGREPYPVCFQDYKLGKQKTVEALSIWLFSEQEIERVNDTGVVFLRIVHAQWPVCVFHADSVEFEGQNNVYGLDHCNNLPVFEREVVFDGEKTIDITSAWKLTPEGLKLLCEQKYVIVAIVGKMTDIEIFGINPIDHE